MSSEAGPYDLAILIIVSIILFLVVVAMCWKLWRRTNSLETEFGVGTSRDRNLFHEEHTPRERK